MKKKDLGLDQEKSTARTEASASEPRGEPQTCARRMGEWGPWKRGENLDRWEVGRWTATQEAADAEVAEFKAKYPSGSMGNTFWEWGERPRTCSFCGGIHPDDAARLVREGWHVGSTDKAYKRYLEPPTHRSGGLIPPVKLYVQHFSPGQVTAFNKALGGA